MNTSQNVVPVISPDPYSCLSEISLSVCPEEAAYFPVENLYNDTQLNNIQMSKRVVKYDDSRATGEFFALDLKTWLEIDNHVIDNKRIGVGRDYSFMDSRVFIQVGEKGRTEECENKYILFNRRDWIELRKSRGPEKYQPTFISDNGTIWTGETYKNCKFRVFIKRQE